MRDILVVDTDVVSEPLPIDPDPSVLGWLAAHHADIALTSVTVGELTYGARRLRSERRRAELLAGIESLLRDNRVRLLTYDEEAAARFGVIRAEAEAHGRPRGLEDLMIAAICLVGDHAVATRDVRDFEGLGLSIIDPWTWAG